jgi:hypothetical protein
VYIDWANNRLKKAGHTNVHVTDLQRDIPDGHILPKIISAVVHDDVPGILTSPDNDYEKVRGAIIIAGVCIIAPFDVIRHQSVGCLYYIY